MENIKVRNATLIKLLEVGDVASRERLVSKKDVTSVTFGRPLFEVVSLGERGYDLEGEFRWAVIDRYAPPETEQMPEPAVGIWQVDFPNRRF